MANLYTGTGAVVAVGGEVTTAQVKSALISAVASGDVNLGSAIGATLSYTSPGEAWEANAETAYQSLLAAYKESPNRAIPVFMTADQHGRGVEVNRWLNNRDTDGMNMANLNLGDTVIDVFNMTELNEICTRTRQIKNYIGVVGNHECKYSSEAMSEYELARTFATTNYDRRMNPSGGSCFSVIDNAHNVKFIVVEEYVINADGTGYDHGLTAETTDWLIRELSVDDGYDIIVLKHWPLKIRDKGTWMQRDGTVGGTESAYLPELADLFIARKNKTSGSFADVDGKSHAYDFTGCKTDLLCCLHGHNHSEWYAHADNLLCYAADLVGDPRTCTFGLIDRESKKLRVWIFNSNEVREEFAMDLNI